MSIIFITQFTNISKVAAVEDIYAYSAGGVDYWVYDSVLFDTKVKAVKNGRVVDQIKYVFYLVGDLLFYEFQSYNNSSIKGRGFLVNNLAAQKVYDAGLEFVTRETNRINEEQWRKVGEY